MKYQKICFEYKLNSTEIQSESKFEVYIELCFRFYNLVSLKCIIIFVKFVATFRSFTWSAGAIFILKLFLNKEKIH